jgi:5-oxoprolinase (ATP-hydrolysing) subunit A
VRRIDLNCDLGEGAGHDAELMPLITSANIACGAHAGDPATMRATIALAQTHSVAIGAHPGFADREHFGRRELSLGAMEIRDLVVEQIERLAGLASLCHVKPHGALYNLAARDAVTAEAIVAAIRQVDSRLVLFAPPKSELAKAGEAGGLRVAREVFADRTYQRDATLTPRLHPNAVIVDEAVAVAQALRLAREGWVRTTDGTEIQIAADTICVHGDGANAVTFARRLVRELHSAGIEPRRFGG